MDLQTFFENFDTIAEAPGGIDKLRSLILDLAVRGKLVPQDLTDQNASELLELTKKEKEQLIRSKQIPKPKKISDVIEHPDNLFSIPKSWIWTTLDEICSYIQRGKSPTYSDSGRVKIVSQKCVQWAGFDITKARFINNETLSKYGAERFLRAGDILWNSTGTGTVGRLNIFPRSIPENSVVADSHVTVLRVLKSLPEYIFYWLASPNIQSKIEFMTSGSTKQQELNTTTIRIEAVPLPPLAEQKRIVAKVDELMALCDRLQSAQEKRDRDRQKLRASSLDALMNAPTDEALDQSWAFVRDRWDDLNQEPEDVKEMRSLVTELGMRGKLSTQNMNNKPASNTLADIKQKQEILIGSGALKKRDKLPEIDISKHPKPPKGWEYCYLQDITIFGPKNGYSPKSVNFPTAVRSITLTATTSGKFDGNHFKFLDEDIPCDSYLWLQKNDLLIQRSNTLAYVGTAAVYTEESGKYVFPDLIMRICISSEIDVHYIHLFINGRTCRNYFKTQASGTSGTMPKINQKIVNSTVIPIPPKNEQKEIVEKARSLSTLCDRLETSLRQSQEKASALASAATANLEI